jgi:hypothetical protein
MKIIKLNKTDYSNMEALLKRAGLVDESAKTAEPDRLVVNEATYNDIKRAVTKAYKKEFPYLSKSKIEYSVGGYLLNLGPKVLKKTDGGANLKKGYAIVI